MSCGCGCRSGRCGGIGALTAAQLAAGDFTSTLAAASPQAATIAFDASQVIGDAMSDVQTAQGVVNTFTDSGVDYTGDQGRKQTQQVALALQLIPGVGQILGGALLAITSAGGFAHAGPGTCANPPSDPGWGTLKAWPSYVDWAHSSGANTTAPGQMWYEGKDPAGSFEDYANRALAYNDALAANCYANVAVPPQALPALLAQLITSWNATHLGPTRTIKRVMPGGGIFDTAPGWDPIANALAWTDPSSDHIAGKTLTFSVNSGPAIKIVGLRLPTAGAKAAASVTATRATAPSASSSGTTAAVLAVGAGVGATALLVHLRGPSVLPKFLQRFARHIPTRRRRER